MLPISKHRTVVIPHRLALAAAALGLALSFTADRSGLEEKLQADRAERVERVEAVGSETAKIAPREQAGDSSPGGSADLRLLPWFSGLSRR